MGGGREGGEGRGGEGRGGEGRGEGRGERGEGRGEGRGERGEGRGGEGRGKNSKRRIQRIILSTIFSPTATQQTENKIQNNKQTK